jgi:hypothetical protein
MLKIFIFRYKAKLDELKKLKDQFQKQVDYTKETIKNNKKYIEEKIFQDPIAYLLESQLKDFTFNANQTEGESDEIREFKESFSNAELVILQTWYIPYNSKQHHREQEEMLNLMNWVKNVQGPLIEVWDEAVKILQGRLPVDISSIEHYEIKKKVVQIQMLIENTKQLKSDTITFFDSLNARASTNNWDTVIRSSNVLKRNLVNLLKVWITFLEDEQILLITRDEQDNTDLWALLTKIIWIIESLKIWYSTKLYQLYKVVKDLKKEIDTLHKLLRKKSTLNYTYIYETNDFQKLSPEEQEEFSQGKNILYKKIVNFFLPYQYIINNLHWFLMSSSSNTEGIRTQINTCQNSVLSLEAINHIPKTDNYMNIWRVQNTDAKQNFQKVFLKNLNNLWKKIKVVRTAPPTADNSEIMNKQDQSVVLNLVTEEREKPRQQIDQKPPYEYEADSYGKSSNESDKVPADLYAPHEIMTPLQEKDQPKGKSIMAQKMKSMQDMLNQKFKNVKNINWNLDEP